MRAWITRSWLLALGLTCISASPAWAQAVVPGTGNRILNAGDDFEDPKWVYHPNNPKSSEEDDEKPRYPMGFSANNRWFEGVKRGHPDTVKRVETPAGGLEGSKGSLFMQTINSGIPGRRTNKQMQDDFVANTVNRVGGLISVSRKPNVVCRVYFPPFEEWENRTGNSFGFRIACRGKPTRETESEYKNGDGTETYWPGFFVWFNSENPQRKIADSANFIIRGGPMGHDLRGPAITPGWWTLGISCSPDGMIHYYAHAGLEDLTEKDRIQSQYPYGYRCTHFETFFFNVLSYDNGSTKSTAWIVDDPMVYYDAPKNIKGQPVQPAGPAARVTRAPTTGTQKKKNEAGNR